MAKIVTVYERHRRAFAPVEMSYIRWLKISEALAQFGHEVHMATNEPANWFQSEKKSISVSPGLTRVPIRFVNWKDYDVVKTLFHAGFESLEFFKGLGHPFIISKLGSVVGPADTDGIPFFGKIRQSLYSIQEKIYQTSKYVTVLSYPARELWESCFTPKSNVLLVSGAADAQIPQKGTNPYPEDSFKKCIFAGNIYIRQAQPEANQVLVQKLNGLGQLLSRRGIRLYMIGTGDITKLDPTCVRYLGAIPYDETWDFFHYADVGVVLNPGTFLHNNESSKIYHYLRAGLPVVGEQGFPNDFLLSESRLGYISDNGNLNAMADRIEQAVSKQDWDRDYAEKYILENHTWKQRAAIYDSLIRKDLI
jgi:glycosyltransferase involved in cell wall biosynthesis